MARILPPDRRLFRLKRRLFQDHPNRLKDTEYDVETAIDVQVFAALKGRQPEVDTYNVDDLRTFSSEFGFEELLVGLNAFDAPPPHGRVSSIEEKSRRRVREFEENNMQLEHNVS
jgi:hypothetical protein